MSFRPEGSPQTVSMSVIALQTQKVGSHLGVLLPKEQARGERQPSLKGVGANEGSVCNCIYIPSWFM